MTFCRLNVWPARTAGWHRRSRLTPLCWRCRVCARGRSLLPPVPPHRIRSDDENGTFRSFLGRFRNNLFNKSCRASFPKSPYQISAWKEYIWRSYDFSRHDRWSVIEHTRVHRRMSDQRSHWSPGTCVWRTTAFTKNIVATSTKLGTHLVHHLRLPTLNHHPSNIYHCQPHSKTRVNISSV